MGSEPVRVRAAADGHHEHAGEIYKAVIAGQLEFERDRKTSLEQRAFAVVTSSGVLVTLLLGLIAAIDGPQQTGDAGLPPLAVAALSTAAVLFVASAGGALLTNIPRNYGLFSLEDLRRMVTRELWNAPSNHAERRVAEVTVELVDRARDHNRRKAQLLMWALCTEVTAVAATATAALISMPGA